MSRVEELEELESIFMEVNFIPSDDDESLKKNLGISETILKDTYQSVEQAAEDISLGLVVDEKSILKILKKIQKLVFSYRAYMLFRENAGMESGNLPFFLKKDE